MWKIPTNIQELEYIDNICNKIIPNTKFENLHICFKSRVVGGILGW